MGVGRGRHAGNGRRTREARGQWASDEGATRTMGVGRGRHADNGRRAREPRGQWASDEGGTQTMAVLSNRGLGVGAA